MADRERSTKEWYNSYYGKKGKDRNNLRSNPEVLFQILGYEASLVRADSRIEHDPAAVQVLDVGCGEGGDLYQLLRLGYRPENITGVDILPDRIARARELYPHVRFILGDASSMDLADDSFDLVFESTMFATLPDDTLSEAIAREMIRVCKPEGYLLLVDWRTPKPGDPNYKALTRRRLAGMFALGDRTRLLGVYRGALVPPLGRFLSRRLPCVYFLLSAICPLLVGQVAYVLRKNQQDGATLRLPIPEPRENNRRAA